MSSQLSLVREQITPLQGWRLGLKFQALAAPPTETDTHLHERQFRSLRLIICVYKILRQLLLWLGR